MVFKTKDFYYKKAKKEHFFARSIYKLEEIDKKYGILKKGDKVLDLGYYPGSWIQYTSQIIGPQGKVWGVDIQEVNEKLLLPNVELFQMDLYNMKSLADLKVDKAFDVIVSDMAPNTTGIRSVDQDRSLNLVEYVFELLPVFLRDKGNFVMKVFESENAQRFFREKKDLFQELRFLRPKSTRSTSKEYFVIGKSFKIHG